MIPCIELWASSVDWMNFLGCWCLLLQSLRSSLCFGRRFIELLLHIYALIIPTIPISTTPGFGNVCTMFFYLQRTIHTSSCGIDTHLHY